MDSKRDEISVKQDSEDSTPPQYSKLPEGNVESKQDKISINQDSQDLNPPTEKVLTPTDTHDDYNATKSIMLRKAEIMASQYKTWYYTAILLFSALVIGYGYGLDSNIRYIYTGYATNSYSAHSLLSTVNVINAVVAAASQVAYARLSDIFGRLELLIVSIILYVVGTIIQSQAYDVQRYCGGAVLYNLGYVGVILIVLLIMSDFSSLRWRLLYQFVPTLPFIINTWISGNITSRANPEENWSWDIAMWAFIFPLSAIPFVLCLIHMRWKASKTPEWKLVNQEQTFYQKQGFFKFLLEIFWRVDVAGILLLVACLGCILVPLTLAGGTSSKWNHGNIIGPLVLGFVLIPIFIVYESLVAKHPLAPFKLLKDRGVWAALAISFLLDFIFYMSSDYLYTVMIVAVNESVKSATRISTLSSFVSVVWSPIFAIVVAYCRRLKPFIIFGTAMWFLGNGLLYHFRGGEESHSGIIGALIVTGIGTTCFSYPTTVSVQSVTSHENMATVTALCYTVYRVGYAVGVAVSGAVWTQTLYKQILKNMDGNVKVATLAYESPYTFIISYTWGTPEREALVEAYKYVQRLETLIALCFCSLLLISSLFLRDPVLTDEVAYDHELKEGEIVYTGHDDVVTNWFSQQFRKFKKN